MNLWQSYLDLYYSVPNRCERPWGFISEPVDTISNLGFFISAYFVLKLLKNNKVSDKRLKLLPFLIILIGIGSSVYHAFHSPITALFDIGPIYIFIFYSIYLFVSLITKNRTLQYGIPILLLVLQLGLRFFNLPLFILGMPTYHIFNIIFILVLTGWAYTKIGSLIKGIFPIIIVYSSGILVRYLDLAVCPLNGVGTHFIWHICVALATYFTVSFFVRLSQSNKSRIG